MNHEELKRLFDKIMTKEIFYKKAKFNDFIITVRTINYNKIRIRDYANARREKRLKEGKCVSCGSGKLEFKDEMKKNKYRKCETCRVRENGLRKKRYYHDSFFFKIRIQKKNIFTD